MCQTVCIVTFTIIGKPIARQTNQSGGNRCEGNGGTCRPNFVASPDDQTKLMADILANLGSFVLEKKEEADPANPRRPSHY
jgi:hypothetical protein